MKPKVLDLVNKYFSFLIESYEFSIKHEEYLSNFMGNALVVFESSHTGISIVIDRGQVLVNIGPLSLPRQDWFELSDVVHYFAPELEPVYNFLKEYTNYENALENQMQRLSQIIRKYCEPLLLGNFSMGEKIRQIEDNRVSNMKDQFDSISEKYKRKHSTNKHPSESVE